MEEPDRVVCVDVGSTFTKAALVDVAAGRVLATAGRPTTTGTDVLDGLDGCLDSLGAPATEVLACSSAGGGLRIAVLGNEALVTTEAGRRVALSSGGSVVAVLSRADGGGAFAAQLSEARADVVLLTGGTDGGDEEGILLAARRLRASGWNGPVVLAGNADAVSAVRDVLDGLPVVVAANVLPRIGVLAPQSARHAVREMFLTHVIGGKGLSAGVRFAELVQGATPDIVLTGVEVLADAVTGAGSARGSGSASGSASGPGTGVVVVDVGGATTDVHSVVTLDPEDVELSREVVATTRVTRTVEGDLGIRWSALGTWEAGVEAGLLTRDHHASAVRRSSDPAYLPEDAAERGADHDLASAAIQLAIRRHAGRSHVVTGPDGRVVERSGRDLRRVGLVVGSGGVLRAAAPRSGQELLEGLCGPHPDGWQLPETPRLVVDRDYLLAPIGLLSPRFPEAAASLARTLTACH